MLYSPRAAFCNMKNQPIFVTHDSLPPFVPEGSKILILGSFPSPMSRKEGFYYAYRTNRFFKVLSSILKEKEPLTKEERMAFLSRHKIALYDVIYSCRITGASDSSIEEVTPCDIDKIRKENPTIRQVFTTGKKASDLYLKYQDSSYISLPSTSAANAAMSIDELCQHYSIILPFLN